MDEIFTESIMFVKGKDIRKNKKINWEKAITTTLITIIALGVVALVMHNVLFSEANAQSVTMTASVAPSAQWTGGSLSTHVNVVIE